MVGNETCDFLLMTAVMVSPSVQEAALQAPETLISAKPPFATGSPGHTHGGGSPCRNVTEGTVGVFVE